jgi:hypothetical protein
VTEEMEEMEEMDEMKDKMVQVRVDADEELFCRSRDMSLSAKRTLSQAPPPLERYRDR